MARERCTTAWSQLGQRAFARRQVPSDGTVLRLLSVTARAWGLAGDGLLAAEPSHSKARVLRFFHYERLPDDDQRARPRHPA